MDVVDEEEVRAEEVGSLLEVVLAVEWAEEVEALMDDLKTTQHTQSRQRNVDLLLEKVMFIVLKCAIEDRFNNRFEVCKACCCLKLPEAKKSLLILT